MSINNIHLFILFIKIYKKNRWFERTKGDNWIFTNNYWQKEFDSCPDIF